MTSLKEDLIKYLATNQGNNGWFNKGELLNRVWKYPDGRVYMADTCSRKLRNAEQESRIAVKDDPNSNTVLYKFIPPYLRDKYIPYSQRKDPKILWKK